MLELGEAFDELGRAFTVFLLKNFKGIKRRVSIDRTFWKLVVEREL